MAVMWLPMRIVCMEGEANVLPRHVQVCTRLSALMFATAAGQSSHNVI